MSSAKWRSFCSYFNKSDIAESLPRGPLSGKTSSLPPNLVKARSREIGCYNDCIALKSDRYLDSAAAAMPVKCQSHWKSLNPNLAASILHELLR